MTARIEQAMGTELDVVWNLTLAANIISANVQYGQIEDIKAVSVLGMWFWKRCTAL